MIDGVFDLKNVKIKKSSKLQDVKLESVLFVKGKKRYNFFTNDSGLYFNCDDKNALSRIASGDNLKLFDSLNYRAVREYNNIRGNRGEYLYKQYYIFAERVETYQNNVIDKKNALIESVSIFKLWNASILAAIVIGMISMSFIYRYLGPGVSAKDNAIKDVTTTYVEEKKEQKWSKEKEEEYLTGISEYLKIEADKDFNIRAKELVKGYPIAEMMPYIIEKDPKVAAFYIAIAKKESNWGKRVPVLNGKDCYNYVGYRGKRDRMGTGGHTCFDSRKEAVNVVSKRIEELIKKYDRDTAKEMVVWKCGNSCAATGGQAAANKWIDDVDHILEKLNGDDK